MATIKELVDKHSKVPGDIRIRHATDTPGEWFRPYYPVGNRCWRGIASSSLDVCMDGGTDCSLYEDHTPKVKRAQYLVEPAIGMPFIGDWLYKNDAEADANNRGCKLTRLMDTEREFER